MRVSTLVLLVGVVSWPGTAFSQPESDLIVQQARAGWQAARAAGKTGGSAEALAPAARALAELDKLIEVSNWPLQGQYAQSLVAAAMAAAQDERAAMEVHLTQAQALSERLETSAYPARWPLRYEEAAGELWFEVEEYAEALKAFERVVSRRPDLTAWRGLARSAARVNDRTRACGAYRKMLELSTAENERQEAREYLVRCQ